MTGLLFLWVISSTPIESEYRSNSSSTSSVCHKKIARVNVSTKIYHDTIGAYTSGTKTNAEQPRRQMRPKSLPSPIATRMETSALTSQDTTTPSTTIEFDENDDVELLFDSNK
jgi:hypothetical protein